MEQLTLWNNPLFKIKNPIRLIELFAGIGSQAKALENLGADFEHWKVCEFDKYAIASYNAVHGTNFEPSDITQLKGKDLEIVDTEHFTYLLTPSLVKICPMLVNKEVWSETAEQEVDSFILKRIIPQRFLS